MCDKCTTLFMEWVGVVNRIDPTPEECESGTINAAHMAQILAERRSTAYIAARDAYMEQRRECKKHSTASRR